jgi:hypothetical protein
MVGDKLQLSPIEEYLEFQTITGFTSIPQTIIYCGAVLIRKAWKFIIDSRFLIHRVECTMIAFLRFSIVTTSYRNVEFQETTKVYDLDSNLESLAVCFCITLKHLRRSD